MRRVKTPSALGKQDNDRFWGLSVSLIEAEVHSWTFLQDLAVRGKQGVQLVISNDHAELEVAHRVMLGGIFWQQCHPVLIGQTRVPPATECK
jgi:hypothetical protein